MDQPKYQIYNSKCLEPQPAPDAKGWNLVKVDTVLENGIAITYESIAPMAIHPFEVANQMAIALKQNFNHATITARPINPVPFQSQALNN